MIDELYITDGTDANSIALHGNGAGFRVKSWDPLILPFKDGGVWSSNPFVPGQSLVMAIEDDVADSFNLSVNAGIQDSYASVVRELRRILSLAVLYWTADAGIRPVYLKKRASNETKYTYATVKSWSTPDDPDPFSDPVANGRKGPADTDLNLIIIHGAWLGNPPGLGTCAPLDGRIQYTRVGTTNLVTNPSFETAGGGGVDVFANWTETAGTGTIVRDTVVFAVGAASAKLTGGGAARAKLSQTFSVVKGSKYRLSLYYKTSSSDSYIIAVDNVNASTIFLTFLPASASGFTQYFQEFTVAANCNSISIELGSPVAAVAVNFDLVEVYSYQNNTLGIPPVCQSNLVPNGDFENGPSTASANSWSFGVGTLVSILRDSTDKFSGNYSVKFTSGGAGQTGTIWNTAGVTALPGRKYRITFRYKVVANGSFSVDTRIFVNGISVSLYSSRPLTSATWESHSYIIDYPVGGTLLAINITFFSTGAGSGFVDAVEFVPLENYGPAFENVLSAPAAVLSGTSRVQITHIFLDEAGTFSDNLVNHGFPANLFKGGSVANITYFGAETTFPDNTNIPSALIMSLSGATPEVVLSGSWQYWDGGAWVAFTDFGGNGVVGTGSMSIARNGVVNYEFSAQTTPQPANVNTVIAWWIRFVPATWTGTGYIQMVDFVPYYPNKPFVKIPAASLPSEIPLLGDMRFGPIGPYMGATAMFSRFAVATRSVSRGADFNPVIPITSKGQEAGITLTLNNVTYTADLTTPSGEKGTFGAGAGFVKITLSAPLTNQYNGRFRAICRVKQNTGSVGDFTSAFQAGPSGYSYPGVPITTLSTEQFFDYGIISLPGFEVDPAETLNTVTMIITFARPSGIGIMDIFDLVLLPVDEFYAEVRPVSSTALFFLWNGNIAGVSSLEPRRTLKTTTSIERSPAGYLETVSGGQTITPAEFRLLPRTDQLLIVMPFAQTSGRRISTRLELFVVPRFYNMRGDL